MRGRHSSIEIQLSDEQREVLSSWLRRSAIGAGLAKRARTILLLGHNP